METEVLEEVPADEVDTIEQEVTDVDIRQMEEDEYAGIAANDVQPESKMYRSFKCHLCKVYFTRLHTLKSHISSNHPELDWNDLYRTTTFKCGESGCKYIGKTRTDLLGHLYQEHDFLLHKVEGEFISSENFQVFFEKLQKVHKVRFVKKRGKSLESATQYFVCSRDGYVKTGRAIKFGGDFVRKRNTSSHKIGTFCTAHVSVRSFPDGRITIEGYTTHYNHVIEGKRLALLDSERKFIKYHAQRGKSIRDIIELIHHTIGANVAEDDPLRFLNARTVRNVVNSVSVEVPSTAEQLFFQVNGPEIQETELEEPIPKRQKGVSLVDVVRGHQRSIEETYKLFLSNNDGHTTKEEWTIQNERSPTCFKVMRQEDKCPTEVSGETGVCPLTCVHCKCCTHIYTCNCNSGKSGKMCQHIHAICQYLRRLEREQKEKPELVEEVCVADSDQVQILHLQEGVNPDEVQVIEGIEQDEILDEELDEAQHIEITQVPMNQSVSARTNVGTRQHAVTALVFHDYERITPDVTKKAIDAEFVAIFEQMKQHMLHIEHSIQTEDIVNLSEHFETLKSLITTIEFPKVVTVEEYRC